MKKERLLVIALDAAEPKLIERWARQGLLPNLEKLISNGLYSRLDSSADLLSGSPWPTFYTGTSPEFHGLYHFIQWRNETQGYSRPSPDWLYLHPFWRDLERNDKHAVVIDIPMTYQPEPFNGIEISGWATHDRLAKPASFPSNMMEEVIREFGAPPISEEEAGFQSEKSLLALCNELIHATDSMSRLAGTMMKRHAWDIFMVGFGAAHRGGHKLWDPSCDIEEFDHRKNGFSNSLKHIYKACDSAVGELVNAAGDNVNILVFSLHGMGQNTNRCDILPQMLDRILTKEKTQIKKNNKLISRIRMLIPLSIRHKIKQQLPVSIQDRLTVFWRKGGTDTAALPAFSLISDLQGYIHINRQIEGHTEDVNDPENLNNKIIEGLMSFVDADSGEQVVENVIQSDEFFRGGPRRSFLPDLIVKWAGTPASEHRMIISPLYGSIAWPAPGQNPDGRSGNHSPQGFLIAYGDTFRSQKIINDAHILDLAPTICFLLGVLKPAEMTGRVLFEKK